VTLVAVLGALFAGQTKADGLDHAIDAPVLAGLGGHGHVLLWLAAPGTLWPAGVLSVIVAVCCLLTGRFNGAVLAVTAVPAAATINDAIIKPLVHRTYLGQPAFPSGHTAAISALAAMVVILVLPRLGATALRVLVLAVAGLLVVVVGIAVIGLRWHYFTDTVAGAAVGIATVCGLTLTLDWAWGWNHGPL
jgi:membrane-associated phospholipid phosphatase